MRWARIVTVVAALPWGCYGTAVDDEECGEGTQARAATTPSRTKGASVRTVR